MLSDPKEAIRKMAVEKILDCREMEKPEGIEKRAQIFKKLDKKWITRKEKSSYHQRYSVCDDC